MNGFSFIVPLVPPGVNHYVRHTRNGKHYRTSEATAFKAAVAYSANGRCIEAKLFKVTILITLGKGQRGDIDGFLKLILDGMADAGVFCNKKGEMVSDAYVRWLVVGLDCDLRPEHGQTEVTVEAL